MQNFTITIAAVLLTFSISSAQGITTKLDNSSRNNITNINSATSVSGPGISTELNSSDSNYIYNLDNARVKDTTSLKKSELSAKSDASFFELYEKQIIGTTAIGSLIFAALGFLYLVWKDYKKNRQ